MDVETNNPSKAAPVEEGSGEGEVAPVVAPSGHIHEVSKNRKEEIARDGIEPTDAGGDADGCPYEKSGPIPWGIDALDDGKEQEVYLDPELRKWEKLKEMETRKKVEEDTQVKESPFLVPTWKRKAKGKGFTQLNHSPMVKRRLGSGDSQSNEEGSWVIPPFAESSSSETPSPEKVFNNPLNVPPKKHSPGPETKPKKENIPEIIQPPHGQKLISNKKAAHGDSSLVPEAELIIETHPSSADLISHLDEAVELLDPHPTISDTSAIIAAAIIRTPQSASPPRQPSPGFPDPVIHVHKKESTTTSPNPAMALDAKLLEMKAGVKKPERTMERGNEELVKLVRNIRGLSEESRQAILSTVTDIVELLQMDENKLKKVDLKITSQITRVGVWLFQIGVKGAEELALLMLAIDDVQGISLLKPQVDNLSEGKEEVDTKLKKPIEKSKAKDTVPEKRPYSELDRDKKSKDNSAFFVGLAAAAGILIFSTIFLRKRLHA